MKLSAHHILLKIKSLAAVLLLAKIGFGQPGQPLVQPSDLKYKGAFRLPEQMLGDSRFGFGGSAPVFNSVNNSLFMVGFVLDKMVAEVKIPQPVTSQNLEDLNTAMPLQNFADISDGLSAAVGNDQTLVGGLLLADSKLIGSAYIYYDAGNEQTHSHFTASPDFAVAGEVKGLFRFDSPGAGFVSGYMAAIPAAWQTALGGSAITGNCCIPIISRTSAGPAAFAFEPSDLADPTKLVAAKPLVYYPLDTPLYPWDSTNPTFNGTTEIRGAVFPKNSRSLLFFGRHGIGTFCYGTGAACNDPADPNQGTHAYPYIYQIWAYDALDFVKVRQGLLQPWEVKPYQNWQLPLPFADELKKIGGAAYDPETNRIFVSQMGVDGLDELPVVHVFELQDFPVSAENLSRNEPLLEVFPNPTAGELRVSAWLAAAGEARVWVSDGLGRQVFFEKISMPAGEWSRVFDFKNLPIGTYFLNFENAGRLAVRRFSVFKN